MKKNVLKIAIFSLCLLSTVATKAQVIDFETVPGGPAGLVLSVDGYTFTAAKDGVAIDWDPLVITTDYASKALINTNYDKAIILTKTDNGTFNLASFDLGASPWEPTDLTITGTFANNTTLSQVISITGKTYVNTVLNWSNLTKVYFNFADGVNNAFGALDNLTLSSTTTAVENPIVSEFKAIVSNNTLLLNFSKEQSNTFVTIFDAQGRQMLTGKVSGKTTSMNIQNLKKGMYIIKTANGTTRFIK